MVILAVDNNLKRLDELGVIIRSSFQESTVLAFQDPLMAGKYSFFNQVDVLFAEARMKRMDGPSLVKFIKDRSPKLRAYLITDNDAEATALDAEYINGFITRPVTQAKLIKLSEIM